MNEKAKMCVVFGVLAVIVVAIIGYNVKVSNASKAEYAKFTEEYKSEEEKIVFIGREGCSWCQLFQPIFDYYAEKYDIQYTYIDTDNLISRDLKKILTDVNIKEDEFGTPLVAFVKNNEVIETINGYVSEKELLEILKNHSYVDENEKDTLNYITDLASLKKIINGKEKSVIVVGQTTCTYCIRFKPVIMGIADKYSTNIYYMNYNEFEDLTALNEYVSQFEPFQDEWGTPLTLIVQKGKVIDSYGQYANENTMVSFLQKNSLIKE